jgi:aldehyde oxidoreductase
MVACLATIYYLVCRYHCHGERIDGVTFKYPPVKSAFEKEVILIEIASKNGLLGATGVSEFTLMPASPSAPMP